MSDQQPDPPSNQASVFERAQAILGHTFNDQDLLKLSLTHSSLSDSRYDSNERLEFLGDAVLGCIVCERIYHRFPEHLEGEMTKIKSAAVSRRTCADIAHTLNLPELIMVGKGMQADALPRSLAAAIVESLLGALYIDAGLDAVKAFLTPLIDPILTDANESGHQRNFKSVLQQHAQQELGCPPQYRVIEEKGPDHAKAFNVVVEVGEQRFGSSWGNSKKQAEQQAALNALQELNLVTKTDDGCYVLVENGDGTELTTEADDGEATTGDAG
ncbi:MAG: ribonuclease-3 [Phycisphaerales bacterium]|jgi:ribonuclease-3